MTDPFEPLRGHEADVRPPSLESIRRRVRRRQLRRQGMLGGSAGLVAVLAVLALVTMPESGDGDGSDLATARTPGTGETATMSRTPSPMSGQALGGATAAPEEGTDAAQAPGTAESSDGETDAASSRPGVEVLEATVDAPDEPVPPGEEARFTLRVCNPTDEPVEVFFDDAQRYDFLVSRGEERVWTWSAGQVFAQVASSERWAPDACRTWTESWSGRDDDGRPVTPGRYEVVGVLASVPELRSPSAGFCVGACP